MTHVMDQPAAVAEIGRFRKQMKEMFTCFDPADLEGVSAGVGGEAISAGRQHIEVTARRPAYSVRCTGGAADPSGHQQSDLRGILRAIDQSDMIISCIPGLPDGRAAISSGVERELQHAHEAAKDVYVVWTAPAGPSVFVTQTATKVFASMAEAVAFFKAEYAMAET